MTLSFSQLHKSLLTISMISKILSRSTDGSSLSSPDSSKCVGLRLNIALLECYTPSLHPSREPVSLTCSHTKPNRHSFALTRSTLERILFPHGMHSLNIWKQWVTHSQSSRNLAQTFKLLSKRLVLYPNKLKTSLVLLA
jgi:hypothetical protein